MAHAVCRRQAHCVQLQKNAIRNGSHTEITFHIRFPKDMTVFEAHNKATIFENAIREKLSIEATIHIETIK